MIFNNKNKTLTLIASPIGNLQDCSKRMINALNNLDILFCEDSRVASKLINLLGINKKIKFIQYHKFNEMKLLESAINLIKNNNCGLISDAGYPCLCDPGYLLVERCYHENIFVDVIDGPSALTHAISQSGFDMSEFIFLGFLPRVNLQIVNVLKKYFKIEIPIIFYEAVHRINKTLKLLKIEFGDFEIYIGRELTKSFETITKNIITNVEEQVEKGEFVIIIKPLKTIKIIEEELLEKIPELLGYQMKLKDICKYLTKETNINSSNLYNLYLQIKKRK